VPTTAERQSEVAAVFVSILRQGDFLIASIHAALDDAELMQFQGDLVDQIGRDRAQGIIIDVAALDVLDSYGSKAIRDLAQMARLRGAATVLVGIQPDVAYAVVQLGMDLDVRCALDLEQGLTYLESVTTGHRAGQSAIGALGERRAVERT
jgi:rsbT antagonist protein RsbS